MKYLKFNKKMGFLISILLVLVCIWDLLKISQKIYGHNFPAIFFFGLHLNGVNHFSKYKFFENS